MSKMIRDNFIQGIEFLLNSPTDPDLSKPFINGKPQLKGGKYYVRVYLPNSFLDKNPKVKELRDNDFNSFIKIIDSFIYEFDREPERDDYNAIALSFLKYLTAMKMTDHTFKCKECGSELKQSKITLTSYRCVNKECKALYDISELTIPENYTITMDNNYEDELYKELNKRVGSNPFELED